MIREHRRASRLKQWQLSLDYIDCALCRCCRSSISGALIAVAPELSAVFGVFGGLTEDKRSGVGLMLGVTALFIASLCGETEDHSGLF
jgi:hypothetical protein